jgi:signal transduction histidine kinase
VKIASAMPTPTRDQAGTTILKADADGREILAPLFYRIRGGVIQVAGFLGDPAQHAASVLAPAASRVAHSRFGEAGDRLAGWRVITPGGDTAVRIGEYDAAAPAFSVAFLRPRFRADSSAAGLSFVTSVSPYAATSRNAVSDTATAIPRRPDPVNDPYRLVVQVDPAAVGEYLYGTGRAPTFAVAILLAVTISLAVGTLALARRFVRHVEEREAFATAVAHDLRTPLTQILLYGESLQLDRPAVRTREEAARVIVRETRRLIHLVENALHFVRGGRARPALRMQRLELGEAIAEIMSGLSPIFERAGVSTELSRPDAVYAVADRDALTQTLTNLLDNAVRFGPRGQTISVSLHVEGMRALIDVDDEGPGVPAAMHAEIFRPFVRAGQSQGTGIGLAVSRQLVELMDGELTVSAAPSGGARFRIAIALAAAPQDVAPVRQTQLVS